MAAAIIVVLMTVVLIALFSYMYLVRWFTRWRR